MAKIIEKDDRELLKAVKNAYMSDNISIIAEIEDLSGIDPMIDFDDFDGDNKKTASFMVKELKKAIENKEGYIDKLKQIILGALPKELDDIVEKIGNTPIEEPEIAEFEDKDNDEDFIVYLEKRFDIDLSKYPLIVLNNFLAKILLKVVGLTNENGVVKHTELTKRFGFLTKKEAKEIQKILEKNFKSIEDSTLEEFEKLDKKLQKEITKVIAKNRKELFEKATDWEKRLMVQEAIIQMTNPAKSMTVGF